MAVEKAAILNLLSGESIPVAFNPEEYSIESSNSFAEASIPGLSVPPLQFGRGNGRTLKMDLFCDTSGKRTDVRTQTRRITGLLEKDPRAQGPPILLFLWGGLRFRCVLERVSERFTLFQPDGTPVRATLAVSFREFAEATFEVRRGVFFGPPTVRNIVEGENLGQVTAATLGDPSDWRRIADANNLDNPRVLRPGQVLVVPPRDPGSTRTP